MKILAIGDIHGRPEWKFIVENESYDKVVIMGDYFDSKEGIPFSIQKKTFESIINFKKRFPEKVILLFGNHDFHYLPPCKAKYSGYQESFANDIQCLLLDAYENKLFQMCFLLEDMLFSHAGVTKSWCTKNNIDLNNVENSINELFYSDLNALLFSPGVNNSTNGDDINQSPIWIRPNSLRADAIDGYLQIVGHTQQKQIDISLDIILIDSLGKSGEYLIIEEKSIGMGNVKFFLNN